MCQSEFFIPFFRARNKKVLTVREFYVLGTVVQLKVYGSNGKIAVEEAVKYSELSEGGFDPTIRPVVELWGIGTDKVRVPGDNEIGSKPDRTQWYIGIQNPLGKRGEFVGFISVKNKSVVTSGNYERHFISNEKRFHDIIDPKTGYSSDSKIISSTIISDYSIDGDGLSTGVYIMGLDKSIKF